MPERSIERELGNGRLVHVDDGRPTEILQVKIFRATNRSRPPVERFWQYLVDRYDPA